MTASVSGVKLNGETGYAVAVGKDLFGKDATE